MGMSVYTLLAGCLSSSSLDANTTETENSSMDMNGGFRRVAIE